MTYGLNVVFANILDVHCTCSLFCLDIKQCLISRQQRKRHFICTAGLTLVYFAILFFHWKRAGIMKLNLQKEKGAKVMQTFHLADGLGLE